MLVVFAILRSSAEIRSGLGTSSYQNVMETNWCHFTYSRFAYSHFAYFSPLSAISPTHAKCDQKLHPKMQLKGPT